MWKAGVWGTDRKDIVSTRRNRRKAEFGDFQTPPLLARKVCALLSNLGVVPTSMLEPTCGEGNFIMAVLAQFGTLTDVIGLDINRGYIDSLAQKLDENPRVEIAQSDFFATDWTSILDRLPTPLLILGNPPWVTNSALATLGSDNLPQKSNFQNRTGLEALTGASNFDISEWMLINLIERVRSRQATIAMLCKTAVARKVLLHEWKTNPDFGQASLFLIDAQAEFGAAVDACLFVYDPGQPGAKTCGVYSDLTPFSQSACLGYENDQLIANVDFYRKWRHLQSTAQDGHHFVWRSGIKHDCAKVMEFTRSGDAYHNNLGMRVRYRRDPRLSHDEKLGSGERLAAQPVYVGHPDLNRTRDQIDQTDSAENLGLFGGPSSSFRSSEKCNLSKPTPILDFRRRRLLVFALEGRHFRSV